MSKQSNAVLINTHIGQSRGKPRLWAEGAALAKAGLKPHQTLKVKFLEESGVVEISKDLTEFDHTIRVSKRTQNGRVKPLLELRHDELAKIFGQDSKVRIVISDGKLTVRLHHIDVKARERMDRLDRKLSAGETLTIGSLFHGGGVMDHAFHKGLENAGVNSYVKVVNELDSRFLSASIQNNSHLWGDDTLFIHSPIETIDMSKACSVDIVLAGVPCTGASLSGRASKKLKFAEQHETSGALFYSFLQFVQFTNPAVIVLENVKQYENTASYTVIQSVLDMLGYDIQDAILKGNEFGALEARERLFMVATTKGMGAFDFSSLEPLREKEKTASEILEVNTDQSLWRTFSYLDEAERKAKAKGNGFKRSYITSESVTTPTIKRTNHKCQSDGVFVQHPTDPTLSRLPTPREHARLKTTPESIIAGLSKTVACEILGQGIIYCVVEALASGIANHCIRRNEILYNAA